MLQNELLLLELASNLTGLAFQRHVLFSQLGILGSDIIMILKEIIIFEEWRELLVLWEAGWRLLYQMCYLSVDCSFQWIIKICVSQGI